MKGAHWDKENNCPDETLKAHLEEKCSSIKKRVREATGLNIEPVYYCAGYTDEDENQSKPYNLTKLLYHIVISLPPEKRVALAENINDDSSMWECDDEEEDYIEAVSQSFGEIVGDTIEEYAEKGFITGGMILGAPGAIIGGDFSAAPSEPLSEFLRVYSHDSRGICFKQN